MIKKSLQSLRLAAFLIVAVFYGFNAFSQSVPQSESFDNPTFLPAGWTNTATGPSRWSRRATGTAGIPATPHSGAAMARFTAGAGGGGTGQTEAIITPLFDLSGRGTNAANVSLWIYRDSVNVTSADSISIYLNNSASLTGATWLGNVARAYSIAIPNAETHPGWYQYTFAYPASFNSTSNYVLIKGTNQGGRNIFIDDVNWDTYPPACTGTPSVDTIVNSISKICGGSGSATLSLMHPITGVSGITYSWESAASASGPWAPLAGATNAPTASTGTLTSTTYFMCVVSCASNGSTNSVVDSIVVSGNTPPNVSVTPYTATACSGVGTTLTATGATTYLWSPATSLSSTSGAVVTASPVNTGFGGINVNYIVTGYDATGCFDTAHIVIRVNPAPSAVITSSIPNDTICNGTTVTLSAPGGGGGGGGTTYLWSDGTTTRTDAVTPANTTTYSVTATRGGCSATDSVKIVVNPGVPPTVTVTPTTATYCTGSTPVMLVASATGATSFSWSPATGLNNTTNDTVYAAPTGGGFGGTVYTVVVSNGSCSASATATVARSNSPTGNITTNLVGDTACTGANVILTGPNGGGVGGGYTYSWSNGPTTRRDTITGITTGGMFVLVISNAAGCTRNDTVNVTVIPGTQPNLTLTPNGAAAYCSNTAGLVLTASGAVNYTWSPATGLSGTTGSTVTATPAGGPPTVYTVTGTDASGVCKATATVTVTASNPPAKANIAINDITGAPLATDSFCAGTQVILRPGGFGGGGNTYSWNDGKTTRSDTVTITSAGWHIVTITNNAGCSTLDSIMTYLLPGVNAKFGYVINGNSVTFTDSTAGATSWNWNFGDSSSSTSQNPIHVYTYGGNHTVTLVVTGSGSSGCNTGSKQVVITTGTVGINDLTNTIHLSVMPNPATDNALVKFNLNEAKAQLTLMNAVGQVVYSKTVYPSANNNYAENIELNKLSVGMYLIQIKSNQGSSSLKLIKE